MVGGCSGRQVWMYRQKDEQDCVINGLLVDLVYHTNYVCLCESRNVKVSQGSTVVGGNSIRV